MAVKCGPCTGLFESCCSRNLVVRQSGIISTVPTSQNSHNCPHFPYFMTHYADSMPINSIPGMWVVDLWNPKYAVHIFNVTMVWICPLAPSISADVLIWHRRAQCADLPQGQ